MLNVPKYPSTNVNHLLSSVGHRCSPGKFSTFYSAGHVKGLHYILFHILTVFTEQFRKSVKMLVEGNVCGIILAGKTNSFLPWLAYIL